MAVTEMISPADVQQEANDATRDALAFVQANRIQVVDIDTLALASAVRRAIGERQKVITAKLAKPKSWAHGLHQWFCTLEKAALAPLTALDTYERDQITRFNDAQSRLREEQERVIAEERHRAEQARAATEAAALERAGEHELAAAVVEEAIAAPVPVVHLENDVKAIQSFRRTWHYEVTNEALVPRAYCTPDLKRLQGLATSMKGTHAVPGVRFFYTDDPIR